MKSSKKVKIQVTFEWEFHKHEWDEFTKDFKKDDINKKIEFNAWDICHHLNQICRPALSTYKVLAD